jgi:hypothetical protein
MPGIGPLSTVARTYTHRLRSAGAKPRNHLEQRSTHLLFYLLIKMSLAALASGAECGPVNPLQGLAKNLDSDRGLQQVRAVRSYSLR